jgi:hypothetical protein
VTRPPRLPDAALLMTGVWVVFTCAVAVGAGVFVAALMTGAL